MTHAWEYRQTAIEDDDVTAITSCSCGEFKLEITHCNSEVYARGRNAWRLHVAGLAPLDMYVSLPCQTKEHQQCRATVCPHCGARCTCSCHDGGTT